MASYPPPYPPPPPYGFDPKTQRRMQRDAYKAQRNAIRAQRDLYRQQMRGLRRRSLLGPILLIAIGVLFLVARNGSLTAMHFFELYSRWWPMIFVAAGVVVLAEWAIDQYLATLHPDAPLLARRSLGGGVIFLLIVFSIVGAGSMTLHSHAQELLSDIGGDPDSLAQFLGEKHETDQVIDQNLPTGGSISLENPHGDVVINGGSTDGRIHLTVHKEIYTRSDAEADRRAQEIAPHLATSGSTLAITVPALDGATADLTLTVPDATLTSVTCNRGDVRVTGLKAAVNVTANHGDVELSTITGDVTTRINRNDSSFSAHNIGGNLSLKGIAQDLFVEEVTGQVSLDGDFYGSTHLARLHSAVRFHTSRTDLQIARLDGETEVSSDAGLSVDHAVGPTSVVTRDRNITFDRISGDISVTNSNGTVDVTSALPLGAITIQNRHGSVNLTLPDHQPFHIEATTSDGSFQNEFGLDSVDHKNKVDASGTIGKGGPTIRITSTHGDIDLRKAEISPTAPEPPPPAPAPPPAPPTPPASIPLAPKAHKSHTTSKSTNF